MCVCEGYFRITALMSKRRQKCKNWQTTVQYGVCNQSRAIMGSMWYNIKAVNIIRVQSNKLDEETCNQEWEV